MRATKNFAINDMAIATITDKPEIHKRRFFSNMLPLGVVEGWLIEANKGETGIPFWSIIFILFLEHVLISAKIQIISDKFNKIFNNLLHMQYLYHFLKSMR